MDIESNKIFLHEPFCIRNNKLCQICSKLIEIATYEEHLETHKNETKQQPEIKKDIQKENIDSSSLLFISFVILFYFISILFDLLFIIFVILFSILI